MNNPEDAKILKTDLLYKGSWLNQMVHTWQDPKGKIHTWEYCQRHHTRGGVAILALLKPSNRIIIVEQFRPPINSISWEFPAGLIEQNELIEEAALRELKEECGFEGKIVAIHPPVISSPGLSSEAIALVEVHIDETRWVNQNPQTHFDDSECIRTHHIALVHLFDFLKEKLKKSESIDAKLYVYAMALDAYNTKH